MKTGEIVETIPTVGFNVEEINTIHGLTLTVWDVGGQEKLRPLWRHYLIGTEGKSRPNHKTMVKYECKQNMI